MCLLDNYVQSKVHKMLHISLHRKTEFKLTHFYNFIYANLLWFVFLFLNIFISHAIIYTILIYIKLVIR